MPLFSRKKRKAAPAPAPAPAATDNPAAGSDDGDESDEPTQDDLMGDQSWAKTGEDDFANDVQRMFDEMQASMGATTGPDVKFGSLGDGEAGVDDVEPEPEVEPEPKPRPVRVKLTKEEKMAKMKAMGEKRKAEGAKEDDDAEAQMVARCEELFHKYDADGGGTIDASELAALCFDMGMAFDDEADKQLVLSMLDTDGDGEVSLDEFKVWWIANSEAFFVKEYSENVKAAIYCKLRANRAATSQAALRSDPLSSRGPLSPARGRFSLAHPLRVSPTQLSAQESLTETCPCSLSLQEVR